MRSNTYLKASTYRNLLNKFAAVQPYLALILAILIASETHAASVCKIEGEVTHQKIVSTIKNSVCDIRTIGDVIGTLPESMRSNFALFHKSRSLQAPHVSDKMNPRAILNSSTYPRSAKTVALSFNGKYGQKAYENLEILQINSDLPAGSMDVFQYFDVEFPDEIKSEGLSWDQIQAQIKFSEANPAKCTTCHGNPAKPIFSSYPLWPGSFEEEHFKVDIVGLKAFQESIAIRKSSRYANLIFKETQSFETPTLNLNSLMSFGNNIRVSKLAMKTSNYSKYKYAIAGALLDCVNYTKFFPKPVLTVLEKNMDSTFALRRRYTDSVIPKVLQPFWVKRVGQFGDISDIYKQTQKFSENHNSETETLSAFTARIRNYWSESDILYRLAIDTFRKQGVQNTTTQPVKMRLVMEGRGIAISNWFLDLKQPTYHTLNGGPGFTPWDLFTLDPEFGKQLGSLASEIQFQATVQSSPIEREYRSKMTCEALADKSRETLSSVNETILPTPTHESEVITGSYPKTFLNTCNQCHGDTGIAPNIPFDSKVQFDAWIAQPKNRGKIMYKLTAPEAERMPPTRDLEKHELKSINDYISSVPLSVE